MSSFFQYLSKLLNFNKEKRPYLLSDKLKNKSLEEISVIQKDALQLIEEFRYTSNLAIIDKIIQDHRQCIESKPLCDVCEFIYYEFEPIFFIFYLPMNKYASIEQLKLCYEIAGEWQGLNADYLIFLSQRDKLDTKLKKLIADHIHNYLYGTGEIIESLFSNLVNNPSYNKDELEEFITPLEDFVFYETLQEILEDEFEDSDDMLSKSPVIQKLEYDPDFAEISFTYNFLDKITQFINSKTFDSYTMSNVLAGLYFTPFLILSQVIWYNFRPEYFRELSILFTLFFNISFSIAGGTTGIFVYIFLARKLNKRNFKKYSGAPSEQQKMQLRKWTF